MYVLFCIGIILGLLLSLVIFVLIIRFLWIVPSALSKLVRNFEDFAYYYMLGEEE